MPPEVSVGKRPDEGLQPDGAIIVRHDIDIGIGHYSDGWGLTFDSPNDVAHFVSVLAGHIQLSKDDLSRTAIERVMRKDQVLTSLAQALTNNRDFEENEILSLRFGNDELKTATDESMEFASQQVLNQTFLMVLPHASSLYCLGRGEGVNLVYRTLSSLDLLDMANLRELQSQAVKLAEGRKSDDLEDIKNVLQQVAAKGLEDGSPNPPDTTEREPVTPS